MNGFKYSGWDFLFTCMGLPMFLLDICLDISAAVSFYQEKAYVCLGILLLLLVGSSLLVQAYSWLWYSYEDFTTKTQAEGCLTTCQLKLLHVCQLGIYIRHVGVLETSVKTMHGGSQEGTAVYLSHDLSMLRIIETFSESAPQLVLMLTIMLQEGRPDLVTALKAIASVSAIAFSVTTYHRSLRSFLPDKEKQLLSSSVLYFLWNVLLLSSRLTALALFASVLPCFIFTHFFCSWLVLFFFAWRSKTDFMDSAFGEWLYRATVGLIWYFDWFNVVEGRTRYRTLLYHSYVLADISLLCGVWCWKMSTEPHHLIIPPLYAIITAVSVAAVYVLGLFLKMIYYKLYHPNVNKEELKGDKVAPIDRVPDEIDCVLLSLSPQSEESSTWEEDSPSQDRAMTSPVATPPPPQPSVHYNKRMRRLAENFYSQPASGGHGEAQS